MQPPRQTATTIASRGVPSSNNNTGGASSNRVVASSVVSSSLSPTQHTSRTTNDNTNNSSRYIAMMKQIYLLLSSAIVLFLLSTVLLMSRLPSPNNEINNSITNDILDGVISNDGSSSSRSLRQQHSTTSSSILLPPLIGIGERRSKVATKNLIYHIHQQREQQQNRKMAIDRANHQHQHHTRQQQQQQLYHNDNNIPKKTTNDEDGSEKTKLDDDDDDDDKTIAATGKRQMNSHHLLSTNHHVERQQQKDENDDQERMENEEDEDEDTNDDDNNDDKTSKGRQQRDYDEEIMEREEDEETDDETTLREEEGQISDGTTAEYDNNAISNNSNNKEVDDHNEVKERVVDVVKSSSKRRKQRHPQQQQSSTNNHNQHHDNEPRLIHILETRFMQNQPTLIELAYARLRLFETICLPSVIKQSAWGQFIWIIRTDPKLDTAIKDELIHVLQNAGALRSSSKQRNSKKRGQEYEELTYVIGSNDNYVMSSSGANATISKGGIRPFDIQSMLHKAVSNPASIFAGSVDGMNKLLVEVSNKTTFANDVVIWTRLDADDGINNAYLAYIQNEATRYFLPQYYPKRILEHIVDESPETLIALASGITRDMLNKRLKQLKKERNKHKDSSGSNNGDVVIDNPNMEEEDGGVEEDVDLERKQIHQDKAEEDEEVIEDDERRMIKNVYIPPQWTYWCAGRNLDWFITDPTSSSTMLQTNNNNNGSVYPVIHMNMCVTPGITIALRGSTNPQHIPRLDHDKIISTLRPRGGKLCHRTGRSVFDMNEGQLHGYQVDDGSCFHMVTVGIAAVRSRTPTSAGMLGVQPDATQRLLVAKTPTITNVMWNSMKKEFGISNRQLVQTNTYFAEHIFDIAKENAKGQCTAGHSCKMSSKDGLQRFVDLEGELKNDGGFNVINGKIVLSSKIQREDAARTTSAAT